MPYGFVLVGGRSQRMGRDKARLPYRGRPMAVWQAEKLAFVCGRAALVGKHKQGFEGCGFSFVEDGAEPHAAIYGILAALAYSPEELSVVVAADIPKVSEAFIAALLEIAEAIPAPAVVPISGGHPQTLCAVWRRSALVPLTARAAAGQMSILAALRAMDAVIIPEAETAAMPGGEPENFVNVNTPEEYARLEEEDDETHASRA
jgi:molybdopterin-guanine dinucleotide biosynthesis protein A